MPLSGWLGGSQDGSYKINLTGVEATEATIVESIQAKGDSGGVTLNATGDININGIVDTSGALGDGGAVNITTGSLLLTNGARILSGVNTEGNGGAIAISATRDITLSGESSVRNVDVSGIFSEVRAGAEGKAGDITIDTNSLSLRDGAKLSTSTFEVGDSGAIKIAAPGFVNISGESRFSVVSNTENVSGMALPNTWGKM